MLTGTSATRSSATSSPRPVRKRRSAPATTAEDHVVDRRAAVAARVLERLQLAAAERDDAVAADLDVERARRAARASRREARRIPRRSSSPRSRSPTASRSRRSPTCGCGAAARGSAPTRATKSISGLGASGSRRLRRGSPSPCPRDWGRGGSCPTSTAETPSTRAWWVFEMHREAARPRGPRSGRAATAAARSRAAPTSRARRSRAAARCCPGVGRAEWRTCQRRSKPGRRPTRGLVRLSDARVTRWRKRGTSASRELDVVEQLVEAGRLALHDRRRPDVDVDRPALGDQRRHVRRGQPLVHGASLSRR